MTGIPLGWGHRVDYEEGARPRIGGRWANTYERLQPNFPLRPGMLLTFGNGQQVLIGHLNADGGDTNETASYGHEDIASVEIVWEPTSGR